MEIFLKEKFEFDKAELVVAQTKDFIEMDAWDLAQARWVYNFFAVYQIIYLLRLYEKYPKLGDKIELLDRPDEVAMGATFKIMEISNVVEQVFHCPENTITEKIENNVLRRLKEGKSTSLKDLSKSLRLSYDKIERYLKNSNKVLLTSDKNFIKK